MPDSNLPVQVSPRRGAGGITQHASGRTTTVAPVLEHEELPSPEQEPGCPMHVCARLRSVHSVPLQCTSPPLQATMLSSSRCYIAGVLCRQNI